jgi:hypothetical protein
MFKRRHMIRRVVASVLALAVYLTGATGVPGGVAPPGGGIHYAERRPGPVPPVLPFTWYKDPDDWDLVPDDPEEDRDRR